MDSDVSDDHSTRNANRSGGSVSMVIRQLRLRPRPTREPPEEIPESDGGEVEKHGDDTNEEVDNADDEDADEDYFHERPSRRHSISSAGSQYSPSAASSSEENLPVPDHYALHGESATQDRPPVTPFHRLSRPRLSPYSTVPPSPTHDHPSPPKRSLSPDHQHPSIPPPARPSKRHKPTTAAAFFNPAYLALLNEDIRDAAARFTPLDSEPQLAPSQAGLTHWSEAEKTLLFDALARLGRDDLAGIAALVRTKGEVEVGGYLALLEEQASRGWAQRQRHGDSGIGRVVPAEIPAAVEVSRGCCAALEQAADAVAARQEAHEEKVERKRWGGNGEEYWLVGPRNQRDVERAPPEGMERSLGLFMVRNWLKLSERVFMNAAVEDYNWAAVAAEKPAVRATALEDFYSVAASVTRRLVAATVFVAEARVRARRELYPLTKARVWKQDVEAASLSLGLPTNSRRFWAKCARRLRLEVYDDEGLHTDGRGDEQEPMTYDEVEKALGLEPENDGGDAAPSEETESSEEEDSTEIKDDQTSVSPSDNGSTDLGARTSYAPEYEEPPLEEDEMEKEAVKREMNELLVHSALEYPKSSKARDVLRNRIRAERAHEAYADALDSRASYYEEKSLWALLDRQPQVDLIKPDIPEEAPRWTRKTADDLVMAYSRTLGDWRSKLEVAPSRWEMEYALVEEEKSQKAKAAEAAGRGAEN